MKLLPALLLATLPLHAATTEAVSDVFGFDVRDSAGTTEAVSAVFSMNARNLGNSASSASGVFALGTQSGNLDALVVDAGAPSSVIAGMAYPFAVKASFAGAGGSLIDVSASARWFIVGEAPAGTRFEGNKLIAGNVSVPTVIRVSAAFVFPSGTREAVPWEVTIQPAMPGYKVVAVYSAERPWNDGRYRLTCNAATDSPQGAAQPQNVFWDLDQDGDFDDATGMQAVREYLAGRTIRIGVRAEWPQGVGPAQTASNYFFVTFEQPAVADEPPHGKALDGVNGAFLDSSGNTYVPLASRKSNGLVIITHGLNGSGDNDWLVQMSDAISTRLVSMPPNVAIYDWRTMADPGGNGEELNFEDVRKIRPNGKAQGIVLADWVDAQRLLGRVDRNAKIHLIGHSAGGFVMGEAARILNQRLYSQIQVTMLDTPLPFQEHIKPAWRTERYISSYLGGNPTENWQASAWNLAAKGVNSQVDSFIEPTSRLQQGTLSTLLLYWRSDSGIQLRKLVEPGAKYYRTVIEPRVDGVTDQHSASHEYYLATITEAKQDNSRWSGEVLGDGFNQSFLVNGSDFASSPQSIPVPQGDGPQPIPPYVPPMEDFASFGQVSQTGSLYQVAENANAGIFKTFTLPAWASTLQFNLQVATPGDGDFVSVHWNDGDALAIIPETSLAYDAPLLHEIDLTGLGGKTGTLTIKLNSRGAANCVVEISDVRILENDDLDGDGMLNTTELAQGSDPLEIDSDGDGLTDNEEVLIHGTSPIKSDTDDDGQNDASELAAGTNPQNPQSRFVAVMGPVVPGVSAPVYWNGVAGRSYRVVRSQELGTMNLDFIGAGLVGANGTMSFEDHAPPADRAFYWIEAE